MLNLSLLYIILFIVVCSAALNCVTCTGGISACTTCDVSASPPRFLREDDSDCVLEAECDQTAAYYWDTRVDNEACAGNYLVIMNKKYDIIMITYT